MHVHLAEVKKTLRDAIEKFNSKGLTKGCIDCGGHPTLGQCDVVTGACDADKHLTVSCPFNVMGSRPHGDCVFAVLPGLRQRKSAASSIVWAAPTAMLVLHVACC